MPVSVVRDDRDNIFPFTWSLGNFQASAMLAPEDIKPKSFIRMQPVPCPGLQRIPATGNRDLSGRSSAFVRVLLQGQNDLTPGACSGYNGYALEGTAMQRSLFVLGDSISIHYGPYLAQMTQGAFCYSRKSGLDAALLDLNQALGANGGDSSHVLDYLSGMSADEKWHHYILLLNCGLHDIKTDPCTGALQVPLAAYTENLFRIFQIAGRAATYPVWVSSTPVDDERHQQFNPGFIRHQADLLRYNAAAAEQARLAGIPIADLADFTGRLGAGVYVDHVHFTEPVRQLQAAFLAGFVIGLLKQDES